MRKTCILMITLVSALLLSSCNTLFESEDKAKVGKSCHTFVDYYDSDNMPWDTEGEDLEVAELKGVTFRWKPDSVVAIKHDKETELMFGEPIWNAFFTDLNGDKKPELCCTMNYGSGISDERVCIYDHANSKVYEISNRMKYDYSFCSKDDKLIITRRDFNHNQERLPGIEGTLSMTKKQFVITYTNGETETIDLDDSIISNDF